MVSLSPPHKTIIVSAGCRSAEQSSLVGRWAVASVCRNIACAGQTDGRKVERLAKEKLVRSLIIRAGSFVNQEDTFIYFALAREITLNNMMPRHCLQCRGGLFKRHHHSPAAQRSRLMVSLPYRHCSPSFSTVSSAVRPDPAADWILSLQIQAIIRQNTE